MLFEKNDFGGQDMRARNMTLYSIFVRNFGGSFAAVERDLDRLQKLGIDAIWLLPIHPIGTKKRKGSLGSMRSAIIGRSIPNSARWTTLCDCATRSMRAACRF